VTFEDDLRSLEGAALRFGALASAFPSFDFPALTLPLLSRDYARRQLRFGVSGRAIFTLLTG
jgi:hypothetical protein